MKNKIMLYYEFDEIELSIIDGGYYFRYNQHLYSFEKIYYVNNLKLILNILDRIGYRKSFKLMANIYNEYFTNIDGFWYGLFLHDINTSSILQEILNLPLLPLNIVSKVSLVSWDSLWISKIDYYEYQKRHILNVYPLIEESFNYYIGLAENAIAYVKYNAVFQNNGYQKLYLCHKRISHTNFFHPLNMTIDYYSRDVAEYIKFLFFSNKYQDFSFCTFFRSLNFSYNDFILFYARLLFPSYYFDVYDNIINKTSDEDKLRPILRRIDEYNEFLCYIYDQICLIVKIPSVLWLKKEML